MTRPSLETRPVARGIVEKVSRTLPLITRIQPVQSLLLHLRATTAPLASAAGSSLAHGCLSVSVSHGIPSSMEYKYLR